MGKPKFTKMQQAAIDIKNKNILVSAAAGSGKTAVLVSRIIDRVLDKDNPVDIDRILVMTFTRAAASQMKEKILEAINEERLKNPHDKNLSRQYMLVHNAYIMTIDSFCMSVVRSHFEEIGLSPDFRMADDAEITLIKNDVLSEVLEECYENGDESFLRMTEIFASNKTDTNIEDLILNIENYSESYPDPKGWIETCIQYNDSLINGSDDEPLENACIEDKYEWILIYLSSVRDELNYLRRILDEAGDICSAEFGPLPYLEAIENDIEKVDRLLGFSDYNDLYLRSIDDEMLKIKSLATYRLPKEETVTAAEIEARTVLRDQVKAIRDKYKKSFTSIVDTISSMSPDSIDKGMKMMSSPVRELASLSMLFLERFEEKKRELNVVDFSDIAHMCLDILKAEDGNTARQYREFFKEIYVDEYQDSNFVQEEILNLISNETDTTGNVFMVGDVKQSIYGFRNAKPEIFIDKYDRFEKYSEDSDIQSRDVCVNLSHNFRSRGEVLTSINNIFKKVMTRELGGIEYDEDASLHQGRQFADVSCDNETEVNLFISGKDTPDKESEALMVATKIKYLMDNMMVEDSSCEEGRRPLKYSDIVILFRTLKNWDTTFRDILESQGIPVFVTSSVGYFEALEVKTILNFLKIIDNPLQDIPFAQVMMSVIGDFNEEDVALIRAEFKDGYLYEAFMNYFNTHCIEENATVSKLNEKVISFNERINEYRRKSEYLSVSEILTEIIDGEYGNIIKAMPGGKKKFANLNMLLEKALEYGKTSYKGIFQFNRYIETIRKYEVDYGEANLSDENDDTVRIMSIHKSKGLEFPVCFVSGISKKINFKDTSAPVLTDGQFAIATDIIDIERRVKSKSLFKLAIGKKKHSEILAEELRLLYVAMTRAKEKLILTGCVKDETTVSNSLVTLENMKSYLDMYILASDKGVVDNIRLSYYTEKDLIDDAVKESVSNEAMRAELIRLILGESDIKETDDEILKRLEFTYPYEDKGYVKLSVSQLMHNSEKPSINEESENAETTAYMYEETHGNNAEDNIEEKAGNKGETSEDRRGALHGTAVHRILEIWDYNREVSRDSVRDFLKYAEDEMLMEEELFGIVNEDEIYNFLTSDIAERMKEADKRGELRREQPFVICDNEDDPESMLVQGVIDAFFFEDDKIVLVDYKTNNVKTEKALKDKYKIQLGYYAKALNRMLHKEIKESVIYSTVLNRCISI